MAKRSDPEGIETALIHRLVDFTGKRVLEIGCGNGRMVWRYADRAASVLGVDPGQELIAAAVADTPRRLADRVTFRVDDVTTANFPDGPYDVAVIAWSL